MPPATKIRVHPTQADDVQAYALSLVRERKQAESNGKSIAGQSPTNWIESSDLTIVHPTQGVIPFVLRDYQHTVLEQWQAKARLIVKSRQLGFSQLFAAEAYWKARYRPPRAELVVSRDEDSAFEFLRYVRRFCNAAELIEDNKGQIVFANGSRIKASAATRSAGRSFAASDVYLDEYAHAPWALEIWQAARPTIATGGSITVFSSPKGRNNVFYHLWAGRLGQEEWWRKRYAWDVLWDAEWERSERTQMTREQFAEEYGADFIESGGTMFSQEDIDACVGIVPSASPPVLGRDYLFSADVAGPGEDATVIQVWDVTEKPYRLAYHDRLTQGPYERFYQQGQITVAKYNPWRVLIDATGLGNPMWEVFQSRMDQRVEGFTFTHKSKEEALTALQLLIQEHGVHFDDPQLKTELELYQRDDAGLVTDSVMAAAIMAWALYKPKVTAPKVAVLSW